MNLKLYVCNLRVQRAIRGLRLALFTAYCAVKHDGEIQTVQIHVKAFDALTMALTMAHISSSKL